MDRPEGACCRAGVEASPDPCPWHTEEPPKGESTVVMEVGEDFWFDRRYEDSLWADHQAGHVEQGFSVITTCIYCRSVAS